MRFFFPLESGFVNIHTSHVSGKYIFQNGSGASGKGAEQKRIFHFAETNAELCFADLHRNAQACSCVPGNVGNGLLGQGKCRKSRKKWKKENKGELKKRRQLQVQQHNDGELDFH